MKVNLDFNGFKVFWCLNYSTICPVFNKLEQEEDILLSEKSALGRVTLFSPFKVDLFTSVCLLQHLWVEGWPSVLLLEIPRSLDLWKLEVYRPYPFRVSVRLFVGWSSSSQDSSYVDFAA